MNAQNVRLGFFVEGHDYLVPADLQSLFPHRLADALAAVAVGDGQVDGVARAAGGNSVGITFAAFVDHVFALDLIDM